MSLQNSWKTFFRRLKLNAVSNICSCERSNYDAWIVSETKVTADLLSYATQLKYIGRAVAGLENIDMVRGFAGDVFCVASFCYCSNSF